MLFDFTCLLNWELVVAGLFTSFSPYFKGFLHCYVFSSIVANFRMLAYSTESYTFLPLTLIVGFIHIYGLLWLQNRLQVQGTAEKSSKACVNIDRFNQKSLQPS